MPFILMRNDITKVHADAIVNAANPSLLGGGGVDGAIHRAAGPRLLEECRKLGGCRVGEAKITQSYDLPSKFVIHTVGPVWRGGGENEEALLYSCYHNSMVLALENDCKSIAFPLISAGAYGFPKDKAIDIARKAIYEFLRDNDMYVTLVLFDREAFRLSKEFQQDIQSYIDDKYSEEHYPTETERQMARLNARSDRPLTDEEIVYNYWHRPAYVEVVRTVPPIVSLEDRLQKQDISFSEKLFRIIDSRGLKDPDVYREANVSKQVFSKIRAKSSYHPKKNTVLALAIALRLSLVETDDLLSYAGYTLAKNDKIDIIVSYFIEKGIYKVVSINEVLFEYDLPLLGSV